MTTLSIAELVRDPRAQMRAGLDEDRVAEYAERLDELPPVKAVYDGASYFLWDGFHTTAAHERAGRGEVRAEVQPGDLRMAILLACGANAAHGLPRTNEDKRRAVKTMLEDEEWRGWTDNAIAKACGVSNHFVAKMKATWNVPSQDLRRGLDGRTINTGAIGQRQARLNEADAPKREEADGVAEEPPAPPRAAAPSPRVVRDAEQPPPDDVPAIEREAAAPPPRTQAEIDAARAALRAREAPFAPALFAEDADEDLPHVETPPAAAALAIVAAPPPPAEIEIVGGGELGDDLNRVAKGMRAVARKHPFRRAQIVEFFSAVLKEI